MTKRTQSWTPSLLLVLLAVGPAAGGCRDNPAAKPAPVAAKAPAAAPSSRAVDPRDQYQLAREIEAAQAQGDEDELDAVARAWRDRRFQWEVFVTPPLCRRADACHVVPFDNARAGFRVVEGWLPRLALDAGGEAAVTGACRGHALCVLRFEGHLADLTLSSVLPTALTFDQVRVLGGRDAAPGESWFVRRPS